jgi:hypothetical protein
MESKRREKIWETKDSDLRTDYFINNLVKELKQIPKSERKTFILKNLKESLEEDIKLED